MDLAAALYLEGLGFSPVPVPVPVPVPELRQENRPGFLPGRPSLLWRGLPARELRHPARGVVAQASSLRLVQSAYGTVADHALVSPDSKPSSNGSELKVVNENTVEAAPQPQRFSDSMRQK